jgi:hypothetical protein
MRQRGVSAQQVEAVLARPDRTYLGAQGNMIAEKALGPGATVRVVFIDRLDGQGQHTHVITVMWK